MTKVVKKSGRKKLLFRLGPYRDIKNLHAAKFIQVEQIILLPPTPQKKFQLLNCLFSGQSK